MQPQAPKRTGESQKTPEQIARAGYAAWNSGEVETFLETVDPEILWISSGVFPGMRPSYSGHEEMREFWRDFLEPWESLEIEIEDFHQLGPDEALMEVRFHARGRQGIEVELQITNQLTFRGEKLLRFRSWEEWNQAIADLGIEDPRAE